MGARKSSSEALSWKAADGPELEGPDLAREDQEAWFGSSAAFSYEVEMIEGGASVCRETWWLYISDLLIRLLRLTS